MVTDQFNNMQQHRENLKAQLDGFNSSMRVLESSLSNMSESPEQIEEEREESQWALDARQLVCEVEDEKLNKFIQKNPADVEVDSSVIDAAQAIHADSTNPDGRQECSKDGDQVSADFATRSRKRKANPSEPPQQTPAASNVCSPSSTCNKNEEVRNNWPRNALQFEVQTDEQARYTKRDDGCSYTYEKKRKLNFSMCALQ